MRSRSCTLFVLPALVATVLCLPGCSEEVAAPVGVDEPFSMYGVITPSLDTQSVLLYLTQDRLNMETPVQIDARVSSTDLTTGEVRVWNDSLTLDSLGFYEHIFWSDFRAAFGGRYRVEVVRSDGAATWAEVRVPERASIELRRSESPVQTILVLGDGIAVPKVAVEYEVVAVDLRDVKLEKRPCVIYTWEMTNQRQKIPGGWQIDIPLWYHHDYMKGWYAADVGGGFPDPAYQGIDLKKMSAVVTVGDSVWKPIGEVFDPNVVSNPGALDNVENGFGFIGGGYSTEVDLYPFLSALGAAGFLDNGDPVCSERFRSAGTIEGTF